MTALQNLFELAEKTHQLRNAWYRNLITLASGALALLVALRPQGPLPGPHKYLLIASWILLGSGILFGAVATYGEVALSKSLTNQLGRKISDSIRETGSYDIGSGAITAKIPFVCRLSAVMMCMCLSLAVASIVAYATAATLWPPTKSQPDSNGPSQSQLTPAYFG